VVDPLKNVPTQRVGQISEQVGRKSQHHIVENANTHSDAMSQRPQDSATCAERFEQPVYENLRMSAGIKQQAQELFLSNGIIEAQEQGLLLREVTETLDNRLKRNGQQDVQIAFPNIWKAMVLKHLQRAVMDRPRYQEVPVSNSEETDRIRHEHLSAPSTVYNTDTEYETQKHSSPITTHRRESLSKDKNPYDCKLSSKDDRYLWNSEDEDLPPIGEWMPKLANIASTNKEHEDHPHVANMTEEMEKGSYCISVEMPEGLLSHVLIKNNLNAYL
jgi:hypothetical protein